MRAQRIVRARVKWGQRGLNKGLAELLGLPGSTSVMYKNEIVLIIFSQQQLFV